MTCPNKNSKHWKDLVNKFGESKAFAIWQVGDLNTSLSVDNQSVLDAIATAVVANFDYFKNSYATTLKGIDTREGVIAKFYERVKHLEGSPINNGIVGDTTLFPMPEFTYIKGGKTSKNTLIYSLNVLKRKFGIDFDIIDDPTSSVKGVYTNYGTKKVVVNIAAATLDTSFHEYYHPFVRLLKTHNPTLYNAIGSEVAPNLTPLDQEEAIVEYLGLAIAKGKKDNILTRFIDYLAGLFHRVFPRARKAIHELSTLGDVLEILASSAPIDVTEENTLMEAYQVKPILDFLLKNHSAGNGSFQMSKVNTKKDYIAELIALAADKPYTTDDTSTTYTSNDGDSKLRLTSFIGDREIGEFSVKYKNKPYSFAENEVRKLYKMRGVDISQPLQEIDPFGRPVEITFDELVSKMEERLDAQRKYGKMVHAFLNFILEFDRDRKAQARMLTLKYASEYTGQSVVNLSSIPDLTRLEDSLGNILAGLNLRFQLEADQVVQNADRIAPEVTLTSDLLGLGTTIDGFIQHANNEWSLIDWKTGDVMKDYSSPLMMAYGKKYDINDSKLNRAKLELAFRALMLKEKFPEGRFRDIKVVRLTSYGEAREYKVELEPYLNMIGDYYKEKNPDVYNKLVEAKLLEASTYGGTPLEVLQVENRIKGLPYDAQVRVLQEELNYITLRYTKEEIDSNYTLKQQRAAIGRALLELQKMPHVNLDEVSEDIDRFKGKFKNISDISNRQVQTLHAIKLERDKEMGKELHELDVQHRALVEEVLAEQHYSDHKWIKSLTKIGAGLTLVAVNPYFIPLVPLTNYVIDRLGGTPLKTWSFMWKKSVDPANLGWFLNTENVDPNTGRPLTEVQKKYRDFVVSNMQRLWRETMHEVIDKIGNRSIQKWEYYNLPKELPDNFMPRFFMDSTELRQQKGFAETIKGWGRRNLSNYFSELEYGDETKGGIPIQFFAHSGSGIVTDENHSFNVEKAFAAFSASLVKKKYYDDLFALAEATKNSLELAKSDTGGQQYKHLANWLNDMIYPLFLKKEVPSVLMTKEVSVPIKNTIAKILGIPPGDYKLNQYQLLRLVKSALSISVMGFKLVGATFNGIFITLVNASQSTKKLISNWLGVPPDEYDTSIGDVTKSFLAMGDFWKHSLAGRPDKSKLWNLAKIGGWLPDNYDFNMHNPNLLSHSPTMGMNSFAFMFHNFVETYGALWHLGMMLRSMKFKDEKGKTYTAWDAYNTEGQWTKGIRGKVEVSEGSNIFKELKELDGLEWKNLRRAYEKLHGSYRQEERIAAESMIWGQFAVQFKKYLPTYMKNMYASAYKDITVGQYVLDMTRPEDIPVYKWEEQIMAGRLRVLASAAAAGALPSTEAWKKMPLYRKRHIAALLNTGLWFMMALYFLSPDDDDEDTYAGWRWGRLVEDMTMGASPMDLLHSLEKPVIALSKISDIYEAFWDFTEGVVTGKRIKSGPNKGSIKGSSTLISSIPPFSNWYQMQQMASSAKEDAKYLFGTIPVSYFETMSR